MICYSYHALRNCWLHAAVSKWGLHVHILILPECITPRVPKMRQWPTRTLIKQHAPGKDAMSLSESNLISVHELLWHGSSEVCHHYSKGVVGFIMRSYCLIFPTAVDLIISSRLLSFPLSPCSEIEAAVWAPDPCLSQCKPKLFRCLVPPDVAAPRMGSVWPGRQVCKKISGLPWHDSGRLSRNSCVFHVS